MAGAWSIRRAWRRIGGIERSDANFIERPRATEAEVIEIGLVGLMVLIIVAVGSLALVPWPLLLHVGGWLIVAGLIFGVPTGLLYHVALYRALAPHGRLPPGWYWRPIGLNDLLAPEQRFWVMAWCYAGAAGFFVIILGMVAMVAGMVSAWLQAHG